MYFDIIYVLCQREMVFLEMKFIMNSTDDVFVEVKRFI